MANNHLDVNKIRGLLEQIFDALNITTFVYVDDIFAFKDLDVEKAIGWFSDALEKDHEKAIEIVQVNYSETDSDIWKRDFRSGWIKSSKNDQRVIIEKLMKLLNKQLETDGQVAQYVRKILPRKTTYQEWSPSEWWKEKEELLSNSSAESKILCLFDQDLHYDLSFSERGSRSGGGLLNEVVNGDYGSNVFCGILSHTIPSIEEEINFRKDFASKNEIAGLDTNRFLPLSKSRLHDETKLQFVDGIKKLVLNEFVENIKIAAIEILSESHEKAITKLKELDVYAFELMVMTASRKSEVGAWEAETLMRISHIFQRDELRELLFTPDKALKFNELIKLSRPISKVETIQEDNTYLWVRKVRRKELYEKNSLTKHSPLQVGDIFEKTNPDGNKRNFILLAQPCDLTVRANGSRSKEIVSLIPINVEANKFDPEPKRKKDFRKDLITFWQDFWSTKAILDCYVESDSEKIAVLEFKKAEWLSIDVLDLSVLNADGACRIDLNESILPPSHLTEGWQQLLREKIEKFTSIKNELEYIQEYLNEISDQSAKEKLWQLGMPKLCFTEFLPDIPYEDGIFDFKLRRVERYRQPGANSLLKAYMQYMARDAEDFDFAKGIG